MFLAAAASQSCDRTTDASVDIALRSSLAGMVSSRAGACGGAPVRVRLFRTSAAERAGTIQAWLWWAESRDELRIEVWNGLSGDGACCHAGESAGVVLGPGERAEIRVLLRSVGGATGGCHPFQIVTTFTPDG